MHPLNTNVCFLLVFDQVGERRLNLCLPKQTSSLEGVLRTPAGLLVKEYILRRGNFPVARLLAFSVAATLRAK